MRRLFILLIILTTISIAAQAEDLAWEDPSDEQIKRLKLGFVEASNLKDPFSLQFRGGIKVGAVSNGNFVYCGYLNAKNSHGAYTGWSRFVVIDSTVNSDGSYSYGENGGYWNITIEEDNDVYAKTLIEMGCDGYRW